MKKTLYLFITLFSILFIISCSGQGKDMRKALVSIKNQFQGMEDNNIKNEDTAILAAGCFWCVEAQFLSLKGVHSVKSGYIGGHLKNPTYEQVCSGQTGHAEAVKIIYNPQIISYDKILSAFFLAHDPTQLNRQGNDIGTQYRSAIFPMNTAQQQLAAHYIHSLNEQNTFGKPVVTTIEEATTFWDAEAYHDNYFELNPGNGYCQMVVRPKLEKFQKVFKEDLK